MEDTKSVLPTVKTFEPLNERGQTVVVHDRAGNELERIHYRPDSTFSYRQITQWTPLSDGGRRVRIWLITPEGNLRLRREGSKDAQDRIKTQDSYSDDGTILDKQIYTYDDENDTRGFTRWNAEGQIIEQWGTPPTPSE